MRRCFPGRALGGFCLVLLALNFSGKDFSGKDFSGKALAQDARSQPLGDLSSFRAIAADTLATVNRGDLTRAKARIKDLEKNWDRAEAKLRPRNPERWRAIDKSIDAALLQLRADKPQASASKEALQELLASLDRPDQPAPAASGEAAKVESARLSVIDIIAAAEKLQPGATVLDVSFEPKDGKPAYAVRTYANGKVWDGLLDATSGAAIDHGAMMDESALDAEDKAELSALKAAKITLRQAIASAEEANGGRALNAGLEEVRGRAVWEILIQDTTRARQIHIDPITGKIL
jgi:uncharacterized membrane protein YkoI